MQISSSAATYSENRLLPQADDRKTELLLPKKNLTIATIVAVDFVALFLAIGITVFVRLMLAGNDYFRNYLHIWPMIGIFLFAFALAGLYPGVPMNPVNELRNVFAAVTVVFLIFSVFIFLSHSDTNWSRGVFLAACPISAITVVLFRSGLRHALARKSWWGVPALVVGGGHSGKEVVDVLTQNPWIGLKVIAVLDRTEIDDLNRLCRKGSIKYAILAMPKESRRELFQAFEKHAHKFHHVIILPDLFGLSSLWVSAQDICGTLGLEIKQALLKRWPRFLKRALDLSIAVVAALLLLPLGLIICVAIKCTSPGPVVYGHKRIGRDNKLFTAWKFRTMVGGAESELTQHLESSAHLKEEWQKNHKLRNDPRITAVGKILRHTSLDELPQLWNVLAGEMSLVGPRPIVDAEVLKYGSRFQLYCRVSPGITGLWQVSGRSDTGYEKRVQLDEYYVRNWSVWLDLYVLGRTVTSIIRCTGAY